MLEVVQSMDIVRQAIGQVRRGAGRLREPIKLNQKLPKGEAYLETEAPKGQMGFYIVSDGSADSVARAGPQQLLCNCR